MGWGGRGEWGGRGRTVKGAARVRERRNETKQIDMRWCEKEGAEDVGQARDKCEGRNLQRGVGIMDEKHFPRSFICTHPEPFATQIKETQKASDKTRQQLQTYSCEACDTPSRGARTAAARSSAVTIRGSIRSADDQIDVRQMVNRWITTIRARKNVQSEWSSVGVSTFFCVKHGDKIIA